MTYAEALRRNFPQSDGSAETTLIPTIEVSELKRAVNQLANMNTKQPTTETNYTLNDQILHLQTILAVMQGELLAKR